MQRTELFFIDMIHSILSTLPGLPKVPRPESLGQKPTPVVLLQHDMCTSYNPR